MHFDFFTFGGYLFWEDFYNYQNWRIQHSLISGVYRLIDNNNVCRESGTLIKCKNSLMDYLKKLEIKNKSSEYIIILHGFARTAKSVKKIENYIRLFNKDVNIISLNYTSYSDLFSCANHLNNFINNLENKLAISFITLDASCLILRKMISSFYDSDTVNELNLKYILNINPINSGSDTAELLCKKNIFNKIFGPMLKEITTNSAMNIPKLPNALHLGILFCESSFVYKLFKLFSRFEGFAFLSPPCETSYSKICKTIPANTIFTINNEDMLSNIVEFISSGQFKE